MTDAPGEAPLPSPAWDAPRPGLLPAPVPASWAAHHPGAGVAAPTPRHPARPTGAEAFHASQLPIPAAQGSALSSAGPPATQPSPQVIHELRFDTSGTRIGLQEEVVFLPSDTTTEMDGVSQGNSPASATASRSSSTTSSRQSWPRQRSPRPSPPPPTPPTSSVARPPSPAPPPPRRASRVAPRSPAWPLPLSPAEQRAQQPRRAGRRELARRAGQSPPYIPPGDSDSEADSDASRPPLAESEDEQ